MKYFLLPYSRFIAFILQRRRKILNYFNDFVHYMMDPEELIYDIAKAHGGKIDVKTIGNEGTEFIVSLPY